MLELHLAFVHSLQSWEVERMDLDRGNYRKEHFKELQAEGGLARSLSADRMSVLLSLLLVRAMPCVNYNTGLYMNFK